MSMHAVRVEGLFRIAAAFVALGGAAPAQLPLVTKLNGPLPLGPVDGDVADYQVSPDGTRIVYRADQDTDEIDELYSVPADGSAAPVKLNEPVLGTEVHLFRLTADGSRVVFTFAAATTVVCVVPLDGSAAPLVLTPPGAGIGDLQLAPDGTRAVYTTSAGLHVVALDGSGPPSLLSADAVPFQLSPDGSHVLQQAGGSPLTSGLFELFTIPIGGGAPAALHPGLLSEGDQRFSPDGQRVFFRASRAAQAPGKFELYSAPVDGSRPARQESVELAEDRDVLAFRLDPTGRRVVYLADQRVNERFELFSVDVRGEKVRRADTAGPGRNTRISGDLVPGGDVRTFEVTSDGARVVYIADQVSDEVLQLFSCDIAGTASSLQLSPTLVAGGDVASLVLAPDGSRAVYLADQDTNGVVELYSVPVDGSSGPVKLNGPLAAGGEVEADVRISPDGSRVAYLADEDTASALDLYSAPIAGGSARVRLSQGTSTYRDVLAFGFAAGRLAYRQRDGFDSVQELHSAPADGSSASVTLNGPLVNDAIGRVYGFASTPTGERAIYTAEQDTATISELYSATASPVLQVVKLNQALVAGGEVWSFLTSPDGTRVVFLADAETSNVLELYSVPADGSAAPVKLSGALVAGGDVQSYKLGSDGARVLYAADALTDEVAQLFSVPLDGSAAPVLLSGALSLGSSEITPDASRVVFNGGANVYSVPFDGSAPAVRVNEPALSGARTASGFLISADSSRVVYIANPGALTVYNLYGAPIQGGGPAVRLNATLASNQHIYGYELSPTGGRVVYRTYRDGVAAEALHSAPLDGSLPSTQLYGPVTGIGTFDVTPSGARVVLQVANPVGPPSLMSVSLDGSAGPVALAPGQQVLEFRFAPTGERVVFVSGEELYAVPEDGSQAPLQLSPSLPGERSLGAYRVSADGATVVWLADALALAQFDLFSVPIDGSQAPVRRNAPLVWLGDVATFLTVGDTHRILYLADQEGDDVEELFQSDL